MHRLISVFSAEAQSYLGAKSGLFSGSLVFLDVAGDTVEEGRGAMPLPTTLPPRPVRLLPDLRQLAPDAELGHFIYEYNQAGKIIRDGANYTWYGINGRPFDPNYVAHTVTLNRTEEWVVVNQVVGFEGCTNGGGDTEPTQSTHPFHAHVNHFQVVGFEAAAGTGPFDFALGDWRDTILVPAPGNVTVRWQADDFTGKTVAHCHLFSHADSGMAMNFEIV
ncbi:unnamed protein product, partial [Phaeothamnion confervicola]